MMKYPLIGLVNALESRYNSMGQIGPSCITPITILNYIFLESLCCLEYGIGKQFDV